MKIPYKKETTTEEAAKKHYDYNGLYLLFDLAGLGAWEGPYQSYTPVTPFERGFEFPPYGR